MNKHQENIRLTNFELLRIVAIMGVVILHYNEDIGHAFDYVDCFSVKGNILYLLEEIFICSVNVFLLISGYFSIYKKQIDLMKPLILIIQVSCIKELTYLFSCIEGGGNFSLFHAIGAIIPNNYYVIIYCALYIISPHINHHLNELSKKSLDELLVSIMMLFSVYPVFVDLLGAIGISNIRGLSTISIEGDSFGYTLVNFLLLYIIGAYLRLSDLKLSKFKIMLSWALCVSLLFLLRNYETLYGSRFAGIVNAYNNPLVIMEAVCVFLIFKEMHIYSKLINFVGKSAFIMFLSHGIILGRINIGDFVKTNNVLFIILHIILIEIACLALAVILEVIFQKILLPLFHKIITAFIEESKWKREIQIRIK